MATVNLSNQTPSDALHEAFTTEQINEMREEDLLAGYRVSGVLMAFITLGTLVGILGVWFAI